VAIKLLIVDDHPMVREGLSAMLAAFNEITVAGMCSNSKEAINMALALEPDIILMDIKMEGVNGIDTAKEILKRKSWIKIIFLTVFEDTESIRQALQAGASGYILKHISGEKLVETIKRVFKGETIIDQSVFHHVITDYIRLSKKVVRPGCSEEKEKILELTPREQEILHHLTKGLTNKEISTVANLAVDTVKTHLRNIFRKLGVKNRTQAISYVIKKSRDTEETFLYNP